MLKIIFSGVVLLIALVAAANAQMRDAATAYGERVAVRGAVWSDGQIDRTLQVLPQLGSPAPQRVSNAEHQGSTLQWQEQLEELEAAGGPYANGLQEPLADLARQRVEEGRFAEALDLYRRSLHILRINSGLASPAQMSLLQAMLQLQRAMGDRAGLDDLYGYYYRLGWLAADTEDDQRWRVALEYLRWQREVLRLSTNRNVDRELLELFRLNAELVQRAAAESAPPELRRELAQSQIRNLYLVQSRFIPQVRETLSVLSPRRSRRQDMLPEDMHRDRLYALQRSAVATGSELLTSLAEQLESPVARAEVYRELGDWEQWNGGWRRAEEAWLRAVHLLRDAGEDALLAEWFGEPVELPDNGAFWQPDKEGEVSLLRVSFDVNERGRARRATATVLSGRDSATSILLRELRTVPFRPRFDTGEAVAVDNLVRDYEVYHRP